MTNTDLENDVLIYQGDTVVIPFEYEQGEITGISDFTDYDKIEVFVSCFNNFVATFSTDETNPAIDADHLITLTDNQHFDILIPSSDTEQMIGELLVKAIVYYTYLGKNCKSTYKYNPLIKVLE